ncbi:hypothetical protein JI59_17745 [Novosphingobium pentaromativorans US6-1]|nr:hypothetical protein JI59_17745 [Novosphingobium pentaromativorans US6-1]
MARSSVGRIIPTSSDRAREFWLGGASGKLMIAQCDDCGHRIHPPRPVCPCCYGKAINFTPVSGRATVHSFTINRYQWTKEMPPPYVLAEVDLEDQEGLRLLTTVTGCAPEDVAIGMKVTAAFVEVEDGWIPVFVPEKRP